MVARASRSIVVLHPGQMGATVGAAARTAGHLVVWAGAGRSTATTRRAEAVGLHDSGDLAGALEAADVAISVCPPHAAVELAEAVAGERFGGIYVDANAIAPGTARQVGEIVRGPGATFVDGGIIGPPARRPGTTRLYVSGEAAGDVAKLFAGSALEAIAIGGPPGAGSALKACYAAWTKGSAALLLAVRAVAAAEGVEVDLLDEWVRSQPGLADRCDASASGTAPKAWRFVGEMDQIAATFAAAGLPDGFHVAAAEVFRRLEASKDADPPPSLAEVITALQKG